MILFVVAGAIAQNFVDWDKTMPAAALAGIVIAMLVPDKKAACSIRNPSPAEPDHGRNA